MTAWLYGALAVVLLAAGVGTYLAGSKAGAARIQARWDTDKAARIVALAKAQSDVITAQKLRDAAVQVAQEQHDKTIRDNQAATSALLGRMRDLEAALVHSSTVPGPMANPGQPQSGGANPSADPELASAVDAVNRAVEETTSGALSNFANLTAILAIEPKP